jgi:sugar/nucleoside kinase (ribokinase family)
MPTAPAFVTISNLIIDDIVLADGRSFMNTLGGAGTHTLVGMRAWSDALGFVAYQGDDLAPQHRAFLEAMQIDLRGVVHRPGRPTARAWQLFEHDERRIEIFRTSIDEFYELRPRFEEIPADYLQARGFHLQWGAPEDLNVLIGQLRAANPGCKLICEPVLAHLAGSLETNSALLAAIDLFSPDRTEAAAMTGSDDIPTMFDRLLGAGVPIVALRLGAAGSLVGCADGTYYRVPAVPPAALVDVTGAGNAYCGGFLVGLGSGDTPPVAAARAAVSASFAIEQLGVPRFDAEKLAEAERRLEWALPRVEASSSIERFLPIAAPPAGAQE